MEPLLDAWIADGMDRVGWSPKTANAYRSACRYWLDWFTARNGRAALLADFTADSVQSCDTARKRAGRKQSSRASALSAWKSWAAYLAERGDLDGKESERIRKLRVRITEKPRQNWATAEQVRSLFSACKEVHRSEALAYRQPMCAAVLSTLAYCGLRQGEVCRLHVGDVNLTAAVPSLTVRHGKGDKTRSVWLHAHAVAHLRRWLEFRDTSTDELFAFRIAHTREARVVSLTGSRLVGIIRELSDLAGIKDRSILALHSFRRFAATHLLKIPGCTLAHVKEFLGHSEIATTLKYVGTDTRELQSLVMSMSVEKRTERPTVGIRTGTYRRERTR